jgi:branched-chain amino acid transport system substrate-binding protein
MANVVGGTSILAGLLGLASALPGTAAAQGTVKIGMVMPLTGTFAAAGQQVVAGARLYVTQHGNVVAGKQIELMVRDDGSSPETGKRLFQQAIVNDKVNIVAGGTTADVVAEAPIATESRTPTVIMISGTSTVIDKSRYFVRTSCTLAQSSTILAEWAAKNGLKKAVILVSDFAPGHEAEDAFKARYLAAGGGITESIHVPL